MGERVGRALTGEVSARGGLTAAVLDIHHALFLVMRAPDGWVTGELVVGPPLAAFLLAPLAVEVYHSIQLGGRGAGGSVDRPRFFGSVASQQHTRRTKGTEGTWIEQKTTTYDYTVITVVVHGISM